MPERVVAIDVVRGLLMLYIVLVVHGLFWLNPIPRELSSLLLFEMPAIFWVSGYAYYLAQADRRSARGDKARGAGGYLAFVGARLSRILVPYLVYAVACIAVIAVAREESAGTTADVGEITVSWLNPFSYGREHSFGRLNSHLWFIPVFIVVTALLPLITKIALPFRLPLWAWVVGAFMVFFGLSQVQFPGLYQVRQVLFYSLWALLGFCMAQPQVRYATADFAKAALTSAAGLVLVFVVHQDLRILDMQKNKFPPNHVFVLFSSLWMACLLGLAAALRHRAGALSALGKQFWLRPFMAAGYSMYLWHGLGYTVGILLGRQAELALGLTWLLALACSVLFGMLAAPAERWRWRGRAAA